MAEIEFDCLKRLFNGGVLFLKKKKIQSVYARLINSFYRVRTNQSFHNHGWDFKFNNYCTAVELKVITFDCTSHHNTLPQRRHCHVKIHSRICVLSFLLMVVCVCVFLRMCRLKMANRRLYVDCWIGMPMTLSTCWNGWKPFIDLMMMMMIYTWNVCSILTIMCDVWWMSQWYS